MKIQLGDTIKDEKGREGVITNIGIATDPADIAGDIQNVALLIWGSPHPAASSAARVLHGSKQSRCGNLQSGGF